MSPRRPRRRARRRSQARTVVFLVAAAVAVAFLVGGLTQVSRQSGTYHADSNRSLAQQGAVLADQSNATAAVVRQLVAGMQGQTRQGLQAGLDSVAQQTADESARAALAAGPPSAGSLPGEFATVFAERARSMAELRAAVDGFLGMQPVPASGTSNDAPAVPAAASSTLLSSTAATDRIAAAGALLVHADALYRTVRRELAAAPGHARLPASVWVRDPQSWQAGAVAAQVDLMATSSTLVASHYLVLRTVRLTPPALPAPPGEPAGTSALSPTTQVGVTVVLADQGSVDEPRGTVRYTMANQTTGATATQVRTAAVAVGDTVTLPTVTFATKPGTAYVLTVSVVVPAGQSVTAGTALQQALQIAPATT
jgi:hypothetical protein